MAFVPDSVLTVIVVVPTVVTTGAVKDDSTKCVGASFETTLLDLCVSRESLNVTIGRSENGFKFGMTDTDEFTGTMAALENPEGALSFSAFT